VVTRGFALRIAQNYPLLISCYYGLHHGGMLTVGGVRCLPIHNDDPSFGERAVKHYIRKFKISLPILCSDFWPFRWFAKLDNSLFYGPIDADSYNTYDIETMKEYSFFVTCSRFGSRVYRESVGREPTAYIPHGVNTSIFRPLPKGECRELFGFKKEYIVGTVAANSDPEPRKGWIRMFQGVSLFLQKFPEIRKDFLFFVFSNPDDSRGFDLQALAVSLKISDVTRFPELLPRLTSLPPPELAKLYNSFTVFLNTSRREGFCLPVLESLACGVPVIASNTSSLPELVKDHGWLLRTKEVTYTPRGWVTHEVSEEDVARALEEALFDEEKRRRLSVEARRFSLRFDWDVLVRTKWLPLLESLSEGEVISRKT